MEVVITNELTPRDIISLGVNSFVMTTPRSRRIILLERECESCRIEYYLGVNYQNMFPATERISEEGARHDIDFGVIACSLLSRGSIKIPQRKVIDSDRALTQGFGFRSAYLISKHSLLSQPCRLLGER